jgi:hypothetical protein
MSLANGDADWPTAIIRHRHFRSSKELTRVADQGFQKAYRWGDCSDIESRPSGFLVLHGKTATCRWSSNFGKSQLDMLPRGLTDIDQRIHLTAQTITIQPGLETITTLALSNKLPSQPTH